MESGGGGGVRTLPGSPRQVGAPQTGGLQGRTQAFCTDTGEVLGLIHEGRLRLLLVQSWHSPEKKCLALRSGFEKETC